MSVELSHVGRAYRGGRGRPDVVALQDVDLRIEAGEFFGILGPNGAGKTTLVRILSTLLTPSSGSARIAGLDVVRDSAAVRRRIGVVFGGERGLYDRLTAVDNLRFAAELYDVPRAVQRRRIPELLDRVDLRDHADSRVETFSRGMKQRLHIARALLHTPEVLLLDEPTSGLDPVAARSVRGLVRELNDSGVTVVLTTHYMYEADELCQRIAVLAHGSVVTAATPAEVKAQVRLDRVVEIEAFGDLSAAATAVRRADASVAVEHRTEGETELLRIRIGAGSDLRLGTVTAMVDAPIASAVERGPSLEDAYIALVGARA